MPQLLLEAPKKWCRVCAKYLPITERNWSITKRRPKTGSRIPVAFCRRCSTAVRMHCKHPDRYPKPNYTPKPPTKTETFFRCYSCKSWKAAFEFMTKRSRRVRSPRLCSVCKLQESEAYRRKHPERKRASCKRWAEKNPEKLLERAHVRRTRKLNAGWTPGDPTKVADLLAAQNGRCLYCYRYLDPADATIEHVVPITRGGLHVRENLAAACLSCNCSKHNKTLDEYLHWKYKVKGEPLYAPYPPPDASP